MAAIYKNTGRLNPARSVFDLSYEIKGTTDMGYIIPVMCKSVCPGDIMEIGQELVIRFQPLLAPVLHEINAFTWTFFVPYRLIDENFEDFITGGWDGRHLPDGEDPISLPSWSGWYGDRWPGSSNPSAPTHTPTLFNYLGFPPNCPDPTAIDNSGIIDYPLRAYNFIYNEYFRDQNLEPEIEYPYDYVEVHKADISYDKPGTGAYRFIGYLPPLPNQPPNMGGTNLFWGNWEKDYFTTCLPFQQRGPSPALPLYGLGDLVTGKAVFQNPSNLPEGTGSQGINTIGGDPNIYPANGIGTRLIYSYLMDNVVNGQIDMSKVNAGDVNDLRWAFQVQKFMERNARIGVRYIEILHGRYGQPLQDVRLERPEYIGGSRSPIIVSEVLGTNQASGAQANSRLNLGSMGGHGITANKTFIGKYRVREFGLIMTLMCVKPRAVYSQAMDREWTIKTPYDLITPEFVNLSEQAVLQKEIYYDWVQHDKIFGFQGRYDEYRTSNSKVVADMRDKFNYWHLARQFNYIPNLNFRFIKINPQDTKRIFAVPSEQGIIYNFANVIKAIRPLPIIAEPGLIDHH